MSSTEIGGVVPTLSQSALASNTRQQGIVERLKSWVDGPRLIVVVFQLAVVAMVLQTFQIESRAFRWIYLLMCAGFLIHHFLVPRLRLPFFVCLSLVSTLYVMWPEGAATINTGLHWLRYGDASVEWPNTFSFAFMYVVLLGALLIGTAHLPIPFGARVVLLGAIGITLAIFRNRSEIPELATVWPILGSMFMFRLLVYMYDLRVGAAPFGVWQSLAYFFMVPNVCFPLFPIVDYKTFTRTYYNQPALDLYQKGVDWIVRGVIQLLLYRLVYQNFIIAPQEIADAGDVARYIVSNFMLYLQVSGSFHVIVGLLHLFGFGLPETHHKYLLSSSFTDFWRRINIYWKDFIEKIFFYPVYFRVKKLGDTSALVVATCVAFFATWFLHQYQNYWLMDQFMVTWQDVSFWAILGVGVLVNVLYELKTKRRRTLSKPKLTWRPAVRRALSTMGMFVVICLLWSLWNARSWQAWLTMLSKVRYCSLTDAAVILAGLLTLGVAAITMGYSSSERTDSRTPGQPASSWFWSSAFKSSLMALLLLMVGRNTHWFASWPTTANALAGLKSAEHLNEQDAAELERGYYEDLADVRRFNPALAGLFSQRPVDWNQGTSVRPRAGFPDRELIPNASVVSQGARQTINRWGMRDRDYTKEKPPGTYRIALLGDSHTHGHAVGDDETYEHLVEKRLNLPAAESGHPPCEILNFGIGGFGPYSRLRILEERALDFHPDAVVCVAINDLDWVRRDIASIISRRIKVPDLFVTQIAQKSGASAGLNRSDVEGLLKPYAPELLKRTYERVVEQCHKHGIHPFVVVLPRLDKPGLPNEQGEETMQIARDAGMTVLDLRTAYDSVQDWRKLWVRHFDRHPNARGHELLADMLYAKLKPHIVSPITPQSTSEGTP